MLKLDIQERLKNYGFWTSLFALIPLVLQIFGVVNIPAEYKDLTNAILSLLIACGVVNNPTTSHKGFSDDHHITKVKKDKVVG